jgi:hypothetical protein
MFDVESCLAAGRIQSLDEDGASMSCLCKNQLNAIAQQLKALPAAALARALNELLGPLNASLCMAPKVSLALAASASASVDARVSAMAALRASATAQANASLSAVAIARLEALAALYAGLGLGGLGIKAQARLAIAINSINQFLPWLLDLLQQALAPLMPVLDELQKLLGLLAGIQSLSGVNLCLPNQALLLSTNLSALAMASARAQASAMASASLSASASLAASVRAEANAIMALRLHAALIAMGFSPLRLSASLSAVLNMAAGLPPIQLPLLALQRLAATLQTLVQAIVALGINLLSLNGLASLRALLAILNANLSASLSGRASASAQASASASLAASASASAIAQATAKLNASAVLSALAGLNLNLLGNLQPLNLSLSLAADLRFLSGTAPLRSSPCGSCLFAF